MVKKHFVVSADRQSQPRQPSFHYPHKNGGHQHITLALDHGKVKAFVDIFGMLPPAPLLAGIGAGRLPMFDDRRFRTLEAPVVLALELGTGSLKLGKQRTTKRVHEQSSGGERGRPR